MTDGVIRLRALEPEDVDTVFRWENDNNLWHLGNTQAPFNRDTIAGYIATYDGDIFRAGQLRLMITSLADGRALGAIDLYEFDALNRRAGVGILIDDSERGHGYGLRALRLLCRHCYDRLGMKQLWAICQSENAAAMRLFSSVAFEQCGHLRSWVRRGEQWYDAVMFQLLLPTGAI